MLNFFKNLFKLNLDESTFNLNQLAGLIQQEGSPLQEYIEEVEIDWELSLSENILLTSGKFGILHLQYDIHHIAMHQISQLHKFIEVNELLRAGYIQPIPVQEEKPYVLFKYQVSFAESFIRDRSSFFSLLKTVREDWVEVKRFFKEIEEEFLQYRKESSKSIDMEALKLLIDDAFENHSKDQEEDGNAESQN